MTPHRWSGWPGAWCLDCGTEDQNEICVAVHDDWAMCIEGHFMCEEDHAPVLCKVHVNGPCPEPGSKRHDPYARRFEPKAEETP
jgi:hypothetical protein